MLIGAIAGLAGTLAMTSAMSRMHRRSPIHERRPKPTQGIASPSVEFAAAPGREDEIDLRTASDFVYGAAAGALIAAANPRISRTTGAAAGLAMWAVSCLGWIPGVGIVKPATLPPRRRNARMLAAHLVWGTTTADALRELMMARATLMAARRDRDAVP